MGGERENIKDILIKNILSLFPPKVATIKNCPSPPKKRAKLFAFMDTQDPFTSTELSASEEVPSYLSLPCHTEESDPLMYWKENQNQFPYLAQLAN